jgi:broad specificity phosphatase PhoE
MTPAQALYRCGCAALALFAALAVAFFMSIYEPTMSKDEIAATHEEAQALNDYNARMQEGVNELLRHLAWGAVVIIGGGVVGLHLIATFFGGPQ